MIGGAGGMGLEWVVPGGIWWCWRMDAVAAWGTSSTLAAAPLLHLQQTHGVSPITCMSNS